MAITVGVVAPSRSSADVITIDDGATPGTTDFPFTCVAHVDGFTWLPYMGFVYRNIEAFELSPGDTIAFDLQLRAIDPSELAFSPQLDIALAHAPNALAPFQPADLPASDFTIVAHNAMAASRGNKTVRDYELAFTVDAPFKFPGGGLIIRVGNPTGPLATTTDPNCLPAITADTLPSGTNRLVGTFKMDDGEYPWAQENIAANSNVPYVRITWSRCGDGVTSGLEECDDANNDAADDCTNSCLAPACGDGVMSLREECDGSAVADPYCDDTCHLAAYAKGSGCSTDGGAGVAVLVLVLVLALRRRSAGAAVVVIAVSWAGSAQAQQQMKTDGFRVDRFEMAPSVEDGLVVQDPTVLSHMKWSMNATVGVTNTVLRVVPKLSSDTGVDVVGPRLSAYLDFAMGFRERFEVNVSLPFAVAQASESGTAAGIMLREAGTTAVGDGRVGGSVLLYGRRTGPQAGLAATLSVPLGSENNFTGDGGFGGELLATGGYVAPDYRVILNGGVRLRPEADYVTSDQGAELIGRAGVIVPFMKQRLNTSFEVDVLGRVSGDDAYREMGSPILALLGARYHFSSGLRTGAGIGMGLTEAPGSPAVRALITVGYSPEPKKPRPGPRPLEGVDSDGDRIIDKLDKCPSEPEDYDGFQDEDGCPDLDDDHDQIIDTATEPGKPLTLEQVITLPAPIEFEFDTAIMRPGAEVYLRQVLDVLNKHPEVLKIEIQGHTSSEGGHDYNMRLSNDRAKAVVRWLVEHGIDSNRLVPRGYGLTVPLVPNISEPNRQRNRRVQFRMLEKRQDSAPAGSPPATAPSPAAATPTAPAKPAAPAPVSPPAAAPKPATPATPAAPAPAAAPKPAAPATPAAPAPAAVTKPATPATPAAPAPAAVTKPATPATPAAPAPAAAPPKPAAPATPAVPPAAPAVAPKPAAPATPAAPAPAAAPKPTAPATAPAPAVAPKPTAPATPVAPAPAVAPKPAAPATPAAPAPAAAPKPATPTTPAAPPAVAPKPAAPAAPTPAVAPKPAAPAAPATAPAVAPKPAAPATPAAPTPAVAPKPAAPATPAAPTPAVAPKPAAPAAPAPAAAPKPAAPAAPAPAAAPKPAAPAAPAPAAAPKPAAPAAPAPAAAPKPAAPTPPAAKP